MADTTPFTAAELAKLLPRLQATLDLLEVAIRHKVVIERSAGAAKATRFASPSAGKRSDASPVLATSAAKSLRAATAIKSPHAPTGNAKRRSPARSKRIRKRVLDLLKGSKDGVSAREMAEKLNVHGEALAYALRRLRGENKVKMTGERNLAKWHVAA